MSTLSNMPHSIIIIFASTLLLSIALTQSTNTTTIDPSSVTLTLRSQWCQAQMNTCGILCSGNINDNTCTPDTLLYDCTCASNNSSPDLGAYTNTLPTFICNQLYTNCVAAAAGNTSAQADCQTSIEDKCGKLDPATFDASTQSTSSSSSQKSTTSLSSTATHTTSGSSTGPGSSSSSGGQSSSTSSLVSSISSSSSYIQGLASATTSVPAASGSASSTPKESTGLSTGAKAGIAIGAIIGVILLCMGGYLLGRRHSGGSLGREDKHPSVPELSTNGLYEIPQLETKERPGELPTAAIRRHHELE